jgi:hypothetical protein
MADNSINSDDSKQDNEALSDAENDLKPAGNWEYSPVVGLETDEADVSFTDIKWSASEFIVHDKNISWYIVLSLVTLGFATIVLLLTHDKISTAVVLCAGGIIGFYATRKPRLLNYKIDRAGITVQTKLFNYGSFKSFTIIEDSVLPNIILMPLRRFTPSLSIYLDPVSEEAVIKALGACLPQDFKQQDLIDRFMQHIRF